MGLCQFCSCSSWELGFFDSLGNRAAARKMGSWFLSAPDVEEGVESC